MEHLGGRCTINSVNYEDGDGPESRFHKTMELVAEHGAAVVALTIDEEGQARTAEKKVEIAERLIADITGNWGVEESSILIDTLTFTICTGQEESRKDGIETIEAIRLLKQKHPDVQTTLGLSNISFGLNPAARQVLNSVFLHECQEAGLTSAIVHASKILPMNRIDEKQREVALDLVYDRRREGYDPLQELMGMFEGVSAASSKESRAAELAKLPLLERLAQRIVDGERNGLDADLDEAMTEKPPLAIINENLLAGMKTVGELFGSGQMQLPFVLQSAEVMKAAVAYLEPHMEKAEDDAGKGRIVLATVKGDVHDIGKNLVDIILTNNGYEVVNIGIKQPINTILEVAEDKSADVVGMSGLLVKSTVVMKENLQEMNTRGVADKFPVLLGGAALTRSYVENDLAEIYEGEVHYARDAFEGLRLMDTIMSVKRGEVPDTESPEAIAAQEKEAERKARHERSKRIAAERKAAETPVVGARALRCRRRRRGARPAVLGDPRRQGHRARRLHRAARRAGTVPGPVGFTRRARRGGSVVRGAGGDRGPAAAAVLAGPAVHRRHPRARGGGLRLLPRGVRGRRRHRADRAQTRCAGALPVHLPAPAARPIPVHRRLHPVPGTATERGQVDVLPFQLVTMGQPIADFANELFASDSYRDYLEVHGIGVQLTEALAEYWHKRVREELKFPDHAMAAEDPGFRRGLLQARLPRCPFLVRLRRMPESRRPSQDGGASGAGPHRCDAVGGAAAASRAVHRRVRAAPSRGQVLQRLGLRRESGAVRHGRHPCRLRKAVGRVAGCPLRKARGRADARGQGFDGGQCC